MSQSRAEYLVPLEQKPDKDTILPTPSVWKMYTTPGEGGDTVLLGYKAVCKSSRDPIEALLQER